MAALQKIRSKSGLLIGIIAIGLLAFIFPWSELISFVNRSRDKAFVVDGDVVTTKEYSDRVLQMENFQKMLSGQSSLDENTSTQVREAVYQQMVNEMMLNKEAEKLGLAVTKDEMEDMVYGVRKSQVLYQIPFFMNPQTRQFDANRLNQFLTIVNMDINSVPDNQKADVLAQKEMWAFIENMMKYQRLEEKYTSLVAGSVLPSKTEVNAFINDSKTQANIAYVVQRYSAIPDSAVQVTDKDIKALYDQRKNNFKLKSDLRKISYFIKEIVPSDEDYATVENEMNIAYEKFVSTDNPAALINEYSSYPYVDAFFSMGDLPVDVREFVQAATIGQVKAPERNGQSYVMYKLIDRTTAADSIKLQFVPLPVGLSSDVTKHITDSLVNVVKGGKSFAALSAELRGGDLGWASEGTLISAGVAPEAVRRSFAAEKNDLLNISINGQPLLVSIQEKTKPVSKVKLGIIQMPVIVSDKTQNTIDNELNQFVAESGNIKDFDEAALTRGYGVMSNAMISPSDQALGQATGTRRVISWAFHNKVGSVKKFDEITNLRVVAIVKDKIDGDYMPVSEVSQMIKMELINDKKAEKIISDLQSKNLSSLNAYAENISGKVDTVNFVTFQTSSLTGLGYEPILNVYAKAGEINKLTPPVKGKAGVYVLNITDKTENPTASNTDQAKQMARQGNLYQIMPQTLTVLKDKMNVEDNRIAFY